MRRSAVAALFAMMSGVAGAATPPADPSIPAEAYVPAEPQQDKAASGIAESRGGAIRVRWNRELLQDLGIGRIQAVGAYTVEHDDGFDLPLAQDSKFRIDGNERTIYGVVEGRGSWLGGFRLSGRNGTLSFDNPEFRVQSTPLRIDLVTADGRTDAYLDQVMYEFVDKGRSFRIRSADLRLSPTGAARIGRPDQAGIALAEVRALAPMLLLPPADAPTSCADPNWPGNAVPEGNGAVYQADVFMLSFSSGNPSFPGRPAEYKRCRNCDGPGGSSDGEVVFAPSSTLKNNVNNGTASPTVPGDPNGTSSALYAAMVSWYPKFATSPWSYPYPGSDQHPYLIWNLYRINANGGIEQIGRSGVKHAFLTTNGGCAAGENCSGNILGRQCSDTYGTGNNDSNSDLGPRSELVPAKGQWGRCGSIYDVNCDGVANASGNTVFDQRMLVRESTIDQAANPGASWLFESWYIVRDDVDIYNTMGTRPFAASWSGGVWTADNTSPPMTLGSAIDRWYEAPGAFARAISEIADSSGHTKVAVRVTDLGNGTWRYNYAVMNFDFAREVTEGAEPNLRVVRNYGFDRFTVPRAAEATISDPEFSDGDSEAANDWTFATTPDAVVWTAPAAAASLNWGTLFRFTVVSDKPPVEGFADLHVTEPGTPASYGAATLRIGTPALFVDGFEG